MKVSIWFKVNDWNVIRKIQERFNIHGVTVNGQTCQPCEIADEDMELLRETERRGYIQIREIET